MMTHTVATPCPLVPRPPEECPTWHLLCTPVLGPSWGPPPLLSSPGAGVTPESSSMDKETDHRAPCLLPPAWAEGQGNTGGWVTWWIVSNEFPFPVKVPQREVARGRKLSKEGPGWEEKAQGSCRMKEGHLAACSVTAADLSRNKIMQREKSRNDRSDQMEMNPPRCSAGGYSSQVWAEKRRERMDGRGLAAERGAWTRGEWDLRNAPRFTSPSSHP